MNLDEMKKFGKILRRKANAKEIKSRRRLARTAQAKTRRLLAKLKRIKAACTCGAAGRTS